MSGWGGGLRGTRGGDEGVRDGDDWGIHDDLGTERLFSFCIV